MVTAAVVTVPAIAWQVVDTTPHSDRCTGMHGLPVGTRNNPPPRSASVCDIASFVFRDASMFSLDVVCVVLGYVPRVLTGISSGCLDCSLAPSTVCCLRSVLYLVGECGERLLF